MIVHNVEQGSVDWSILRSGIPTASEFDNLLTAKFKVRTGEMPRSYLAKKVAEKWQGGPLASLNVFDVEQGRILEGEALPYYTLETGEEVQRVGFITTDDGRIGCSPDGLIGDEGGIEIKCPAVHTHVNYLLTGTLPDEYATQVHGSMYVTGRKWWKFLSYCRHFPPLMITVHRDAEIQERIHEALTGYLKDFDAAMAKLTEINGGPPLRKTFRPAAPPKQPELHTQEVTP